MKRDDEYLLPAYRDAAGSQKVRRVPSIEKANELVQRREKLGKPTYRLRMFILFPLTAFWHGKDVLFRNPAPDRVGAPWPYGRTFPRPKRKPTTTTTTTTTANP